MKRVIISRTAAVAFIALAVSACGTPTSAVDRGSYAIDQIALRGDSVQRVRPYRTLADLLPNVSLQAPDQASRPASEAAVLGRIVEVVRGKAFVDAERGANEVPFDSDKASWRTLHLRVQVEESLGGLRVPDQLLVGLSIGGSTDVADMSDSLESLGQVLLFLNRGGAVFAYERDLYSIAEDGHLLVTVATNGKVGLPALPEEERATMFGSLRSIDDIRAAATAPPRTIALTALGDRLDEQPASTTAP